ncbi:MAG: caspase family protein [Spirochaetota bacterium]|nr:caspase family protein [Spirochaetota bacterium]
MKSRRSLLLIITLIITLLSALTHHGETKSRVKKIDYSKYEKNSPVEMVLQSGHTSSVTSVAFSPNGNIIASGSYDNTVRLWSLDGWLLKILKGHTGVVNSIAFSSDGNTIASGSGDGTVRCWSLDGRLLKTLKGHTSMVYSVAFSPNGNTIASGSIDNTVRLWSLDGRLLKTFKGHSADVNSVAFSPDGNSIASGSDDKIKLCSLDGSLIKTLKGHTNYVRSVAFSPDGNIIASGSMDKTVRLWRRDGRLIKTLKGHSSLVYSVAFSPDGNTIASGSMDKTVRLWSLDGRLLKTLKGHTTSNIAFSPDGNSIASGSGVTLRFCSLDGGLLKTLKGHTCAVWSVAYSLDGNTIASGSGDNTLRLWSRDGRLIKTLKGHTSLGTSVAFSPNGNTIASGDNKTVRLCSLDGSLIKTLKGHTNYVRSVAFSPDGNIIASGSMDKTVRLWRRDGSLIKTLKGHTNYVRSVAFSPDGNIIASGSMDKTVRLWSLDGNGRLLKTLKGHSAMVSSIAFSPDGNTIASSSFDNTVRLWSLEGNLLKTLEHSAMVSSVAFSPDGNTIASGTLDTTVRLWSLDGRLLKTFKGHSADVNSVAFSPDGNTLVSGSGDGTMRIWKTKTGRSISVTTFDTGDWHVCSDNGNFDCSSGGRKYVSFVKGLTPYKPDQFWNTFFTPGLFSKFMNGKRLKKINIENNIKNAPRVYITKPKRSITTGKETVKITINAKAKKNGVGNIFLYQNGRTLDEETRGFKITKRGKTREFTVFLLPGQNTFIGAAFDRSNLSEGRSSELIVYYKPKRITKPDMYIVSVGVSRYRDVNIRLKSPNKDAAAISGTFKSVSSTLYGRVHQTVLTDQKASKNGILGILNNVSGKVRSIDTVIIFLAGHGITEKKIYYFLPYDADITDLNGSCVTIDAISAFIRKLPANKVALFLDTCQSGGATRKLGMVAMARGIEDRRIIATLAKERGIAVFSAASADQSAFELKELDHGIFTYSMISALKNRKNEIKTSRNLISISRLLGIVNEMTRDIAYQKLKIEQNPVMYIFGDDFAIGAAN